MTESFAQRVKSSRASGIRAEEACLQSWHLGKDPVAGIMPVTAPNPIQHAPLPLPPPHICWVSHQPLDRERLLPFTGTQLPSLHLWNTLEV